jgi:hypothetical protein
MRACVGTRTVKVCLLACLAGLLVPGGIEAQVSGSPAPHPPAQVIGTDHLPPPAPPAGAAAPPTRPGPRPAPATPSSPFAQAPGLAPTSPFAPAPATGAPRRLLRRQRAGEEPAQRGRLRERLRSLFSGGR